LIDVPLKRECKSTQIYTCAKYFYKKNQQAKNLLIFMVENDFD